MSIRPLQLTKRDEQVLADLGDFRFLTAPQVAALHFPSPRAAQDRLRRLIEHELAVKVFAPVNPYDRTSHIVYGLRAKGSRLVAERRGGERPSFLTERDRRSALFLDHTLRRNDVRICFELLARDATVQTGPWLQKPESVGASARVFISARRKARVPMVPDGFIAVVEHGRCHAFIVEVDMGTVTLKRMKLRYRAYWHWWKHGGYRAKWGGAPLRVLTLAIDEKRVEALRKIAVEAPERGRGSKLFWFTELANADIHDPSKMLAPVWRLATGAVRDQQSTLFS